jgi:hypothetical protein
MLPSAKAARGVSVGRKILHPHADLSFTSASYHGCDPQEQLTRHVTLPVAQDSSRVPVHGELLISQNIFEFAMDRPWICSVF